MEYKEKLEYNRNWRRKVSYERRKFIHEALGLKCNMCGFRDDRILQIDHIFGDGKSERKAHGDYNWMIRNMYRMCNDDRHEFLKHYQLLCPNCNWIKRIENKEDKNYSKYH